jgi:hypothetical protein
MHTPELEKRIGPGLRELAGVTESDPAPAVRAKLRETMSALSENLPAAERLTVRAALSLDDDAGELLSVRIEKVAWRLDRDVRTARRVMERGFSRLVEQAMRRAEQRTASHDGSHAAAFRSRPPVYDFSRVVLPPTVRERVITALGPATHRRVLVEDWGLDALGPASGVALNFFGPSGTGKTMAAHAVASHLGRPILTATHADIDSRHHGEGARAIRALFQAAERDNAVLFIDEADSWLGRRITVVESGADLAFNALRSELIHCLDTLRGVAVFATNRVGAYDPAFVSRLQSIEFPAPDAEARLAVFRLHCPPQLPLTADITDESVAPLLDGLVGRDITHLIIAAAERAAHAGRSAVSYADLAWAAEEQRASRLALGEV